MLAPRQADTALAEGGPGLSAAGVGHAQRPSYIRTIDLGMEAGACRRSRYACVESIAACSSDIDGVLEPLAGPRPADVEAAAGIGSSLDIDTVAGAVGAATVRRIIIVV